jgi:hypothetical protein
MNEETCGNGRCCRSSIAHRLERGDACICFSTKGARYCENKVAFLRSPNSRYDAWTQPKSKVFRTPIRGV